MFLSSRIFLLALLGGVAASLAACEGDDGSDIGPDERPSCAEADLLLAGEESVGGAGGAAVSETARILTDEPSGLVQCGAEGRMNRKQALDCGAPLSFDQTSACDGFGYGYPEVCDGFDYDAWESAGDDACATPGCIVQVGCQSDAECASDEACVCASGRDDESSRNEQSISRCVPASCRINDDCESGECGALLGDCGADIMGFACRTADDECRDDEECPGGRCGFDETRERWVCSSYAECE